MRLLAWLRALVGAPRAIQNLQHDSRYLRPVVLGIPFTLHKLERLIVTTASDLVARLDAATTEVASDLGRIRDQLTEALAGTDAAAQAAVTAALAGFDAPIARLEALGQDPADPVPAPAEPVVEPAPAPADPETPAGEQA